MRAFAVDQVSGFFLIHFQLPVALQDAATFLEAFIDSYVRSVALDICLVAWNSPLSKRNLGSHMPLYTLTPPIRNQRHDRDIFWVQPPAARPHGFDHAQFQCTAQPQPSDPHLVFLPSRPRRRLAERRESRRPLQGPVRVGRGAGYGRTDSRDSDAILPESDA